MKLAAVYNTFDGEELLEGSIKQIYDLVDEVIIIYQRVSNYGESYEELIYTLLNIEYRYPKCRFFHYEPDFSLNGACNEVAKRRLGVEKAGEMGCTHFLLMDNDEYYEPEAFSKAKREVAVNDYDATACRLYTYYKQPEYRLEPMEKYYVPFICKLKPNTVIGQGFNVYADPTRGVRPVEHFHLFPVGEMAMHHFSYVRKDIGRKLRNSSARPNFGDVKELTESFEQWQPGKPMINFAAHCINKVENKFKIQL